MTRLPRGAARGSAALSSIILVATALAGCSSLLPRTQAETRGSWSSFEEAKTAIEQIEPHRTRAADLHAMGLDPYANPNVTLLNYSDILRRFPLAGSLTHLDSGLRECLQAGKTCTGYAVELATSNKERVGPFLLDLLSFRRETQRSGWTFNAIVLMVDGEVVYWLYGGKPSISETEKTVEPLGPLQDWNGSGLIR
jgi:hypothetical protein